MVQRRYLSSLPKIITRPLLFAVVGVLIAALLVVARPAAAQEDYIRYVGYGQSIEGEVRSPTGSEHLFAGCVGETVTISVTAEDFSPRLDLYNEVEIEPLQRATTSASGRRVAIHEFTLPSSGPYFIVVSGRSRNDRGRYTLEIEGEIAADAIRDDTTNLLNIIYGDSIYSALDVDEHEGWYFRGCDGDEILVEVEASGFVPEVELHASIAELPIATAIVEEGVGEAGDDGVRAELRHTLPATGPYFLSINAEDDGAGDYSLGLTLVATAPPAIEPAETPLPVSTPTPTDTPSSGPRGRRGIPIPRGTSTATPGTTVTPGATATPAPTRTGATPTVTPTRTPANTPTPTLVPTVTPTTETSTIILEIFCTVIAERLNLRPGPGTNFTPPIDVLEIGDLLVVNGRNEDGSWVLVDVLDVNLEVEASGWVSVEFLLCIGDVADAPVVEVTP